MSDTTRLAIAVSETQTESGHEARVPGLDAGAELTTSKVSDRLVIVDHAYVPDELRGMGVAGALAERAIAGARGTGQRRMPLCPVLRSDASKRTEEVNDVIQW
ncbi:MAG: N-acetyltransferase [Pseudomonadota bacterium]